MKKVGIMSMQRIKNYGSFMQAYCLKKKVEEITGAEVEFVDYNVEPCVENDNKLDEVKYPSILQMLKRKYIGAKFTFFYNYVWLPKYLNVKKEKNYNKNVDTLIIGSDEVFNCTQSNEKIGYSRELFGKGFKKVISYAASFGYTTIERLKKFNIEEEVGNLLKNFKKISIRDKNSNQIIRELIQIEPEENLDPVLISGIQDTINSKFNMKDYIIVYAYSGRINKEETEKIKEFAKKNNKKVISLGTYQECADRNLVLDPFKMLACFKNADYIITDTFHGSIFSIIFNKKFATIIRKSNEAKLHDLLFKLNLADREIKHIDELETTIKKDIDYSKTKEIIENETNKSKKYLKDNV